MKRHIALGWLLSCIFLLGACIDDKGNYTYTDEQTILPIQISGLDDDMTVLQNSELNLSPTVTNDDKGEYTYSWVISEARTAGALPKKYEIGNTKNLSYKVILDPGEWLLNFSVHDEKRDLFRRKEIRVNITGVPIGSGYYILKDQDGETDFDFVNIDGEKYENLLLPTGQRPKGKALNMAHQEERYYHIIYDEDGNATTLANQSVFYITTDQDIRTYNAMTLKHFKSFDDQFYTAPKTVRPGYAYNVSGGDSFLMNDGKIYSIYGMSSNIGKFSAAKVCLNALYNNFMPGFFSNVVVFDETAHSFYTADTGYEALMTMKETTLENGQVLSLSNMPYSIKSMNSNTFYIFGYSYVVMVNDNDGKAILLRHGTYEDDFVSCKTIPDNSKLLESDVIAPSFTADFLYFAVNDQVYAYQNSEDLEVKEKLILEYPGETVAFMRHVCNYQLWGDADDNDANDLCVLTSTANGWKLYVYRLIGESTPEINPQPIAVYEGEGNARYLMYRPW